MTCSQFWQSSEWHAYERAYGDEPGTRERLLASAAWKTRVLDLRQDETALWCGVRKSYHSIINRLTRDADFRIAAVIGRQFLEDCLPMQTRLEGRETRPRASWNVQADWLSSGIGRCYVATREWKPVAFMYMITWNDWAYYGFSKTEEPNAHHALMWHAIRTLKSDGVRWLELGWQ
mgnify:CR=1 FL=1